MSKNETYSSESIFQELKQNKPGNTNEAMRELNCDLHHSKDFNATYQHLQQRIAQYNKGHAGHELPDLKLQDSDGHEIKAPVKDRKKVDGMRLGGDDKNTEYKRDTYRHQVSTDTVDGGTRISTDSKTNAKQAYDSHGNKLQTTPEKDADGKETGNFTVVDGNGTSTTYDKNNKKVAPPAPETATTTEAGKKTDGTATPAATTTTEGATTTEAGKKTDGTTTPAATTTTEAATTTEAGKKTDGTTTPAATTTEGATTTDAGEWPKSTPFTMAPNDAQAKPDSLLDSTGPVKLTLGPNSPQTDPSTSLSLDGTKKTDGSATTDAAEWPKSTPFTLGPDASAKPESLLGDGSQPVTLTLGQNPPLRDPSRFSF